MNLRIATTWLQRLKGLRGCPHGCVLLLIPCRDVHTLGLTSDIDIAFIDKQGVVLQSTRSVPPNRRQCCSEAVAVLERFAEPEAPWYIAGDSILRACIET